MSNTLEHNWNEMEMTSCELTAKNSCCSSGSSDESIKTHWDNAYKGAAAEELGWYEDIPEPSLRLIERSGVSKDASILNVGAGSTKLVDYLLQKGFQNIIANDISSVALNDLKKRLGAASGNVTWIVDDITNPEKLNSLKKVDLWHDRAVLHFFQEPKEQNSYFELLKRVVSKNGYVIIAAFNLNGATKCSGVPVLRYDEQMLQEKLGDEFELIDFFNFNNKMPSNQTRAYIYTLFQRS